MLFDTEAAADSIHYGARQSHGKTGPIRPMTLSIDAELDIGIGRPRVHYFGKVQVRIGSFAYSDVNDPLSRRSAVVNAENRPSQLSGRFRLVPIVRST